MQSQFIKTCAALGTVGIVGSAFAGDTVRFDVSWSDTDIFFVDFAAGDVPANLQPVDTADPGRYFGSVGFSNVDVNVCWNAGTSYTGWASEVVFDFEAVENDALNWFVISPFAGDNTGSDVEGECSNRQALPEVDVPLLPFTYRVSDAGSVRTGMSATWNDGTGLRHSEVNTADFYFVLAGDVPATCVGATGSCGEVHPEPGFSDISCCALTCDLDQGGDPFCCESSWDSNCVALAVALCQIFQYSCDDPAYANDCATSPIILTNGVGVAFNTVGANTDGPGELGCGSAYEDLQVWSDLWYKIELTDESTVTATCCNTANFDTKIAIYDGGAVGSTIDPANLPDLFLACNEDCDDPDFFTSELIATSLAPGQYLIRVGGFQQATGSGDITVSWEEPAPQLPDPACDNPRRKETSDADV